ncbi:P-loop containing nucleoside triphosphate hydrolase protein, partial [Phakopsora pachyrhizi]
SKSLAQPTSASEVMSSDSDSPNLRRRSKRQKKHYRRSSLSSTSDQTQLNPKNVRRSTRSSQSRPKYNFRTHISSEEEEEEDELEESGSDRSKQKKNRKNQRYVMSEESDESEYKSGRSRSRNRSKAVARKGFSPEGRKPRSEHHPDCTKCGIEFQPGLVSAWIKADKNRKSKVRTGSLLDRFLSLEEVYAQGCWLECSDCSSSYHFGCLPADMKKDIAAQHKAERLSIMEQLEKNSENNPGKIINPSEIPPERKERQPDLKLVTKCPMCFKSNGALCMKCGNNSDLKHQTTNASLSAPGSPPRESMGKLPFTVSTEKEDEAEVDELEKDSVSKDSEGRTLLFRCISCRRVAHYSCLPSSGEDYPTDLDEIAEYWQRDWSCADCDELSNIELENILAWRRPTIKKTSHTTPPSAPEQSILGSLHDSPRGRDNNKTRSDVKLPSWKHPFEEAEYLCKYVDFSYSDCSWLTHSYLAARYPQRLRSFLTNGPLVDLKQFSEGRQGFDSDSDEDSVDIGDELPFNLNPDENAEQKIPKAWLTPERILSIEFDDEETIEDLDENDIPKTPELMYEKMGRAFIKWQEQSYAAATWTDKITKTSPFFPAFWSALENYMKFRKFAVPFVKSERELEKLDAPRRESQFRALEKQPRFIPNELMNFQLEGLNFCYYNWHRQHPTILADEMGLGKTVQICSLISVLKHQERRMPFLICVPNSTLGNWVRECNKWIPDLKVVSLPGDAESCEIIEEWDMFQPGVRKSQRKLAAHVVLTTYQAAEKSINLLRRVQRWEVVIVDEGQRLKSGAKGGLFRALSSLRDGHRIIMTGTPLNNNLRELFNLLSFLNPEEYPESKIDELELRYTDLTPELVDEVRGIIRPYMLRRTKETALDLPSLTEIIVPITMRPLQKRVYRGILSRNADLITSIYAKRKSKTKAKTTRANFNNLLMQLRKVLAHPYLQDWQIEPADVTEQQAHENLTEASAKLVFLQRFLPKLLERNHRILIFSQFTMLLDIMERFFDGEKLDYLRLDGTTSQLDRQTRIDCFNRPNSSYNIFLLSTKAGGAGINLATADTVIMLDPDYNPHNDLQAISRAHRYGQKKPVSVFKLMTKSSAEERIIQTGKKKLVLDHLVIQKASEEETEAMDVETILQYGAQELLTENDETLNKDVRYTDEELDDLIQRIAEPKQIENEGEGNTKVDKTFSFARVWEGRGKDLGGVTSVEEIDNSHNVNEQRTFWDNILQANQEEERKNRVEAETVTGRGHRKRKEVVYNHPAIDDSPKKKARSESVEDNKDENFVPEKMNEVESDSDSTVDEEIQVISEAVDLSHMTEVQIKENREREERRAAERRKRHLKEMYDSKTLGNALQGSSVQHGHGNSNTSGAAYMNYFQENQNEFNTSSPLSPTLSLIKIPDLEGLPNSEARSKMDWILRDLIIKAKALRNLELDSLLSSIRAQGIDEQIHKLENAWVNFFVTVLIPVTRTPNI